MSEMRSEQFCHRTQQGRTTCGLQLWGWVAGLKTEITGPTPSGSQSHQETSLKRGTYPRGSLDKVWEQLAKRVQSSKDLYADGHRGVKPPADALLKSRASSKGLSSTQHRQAESCTVQVRAADTA